MRYCDVADADRVIYPVLCPAASVRVALYLLAALDARPMCAGS